MKKDGSSPCKNSTSIIYLYIDHNECCIKLDFEKKVCGRKVESSCYSDYCLGKSLDKILNLKFSDVCLELHITGEKKRFGLYLEWDSLRAAIAQYLGIDDPNIDRDRCQISSIEYDESGIKITQVVLPPKQMPKILLRVINKSKHS